MSNVLVSLAGLATPASGGAARVAEGLALFGGRSGLAAAIAGTHDTKSAAYKGALRNVERWDKALNKAEGQARNPDKMRAATYEKLGQAIERGKLPDAAEFDVKGTVTISKDTRQRRFSVELTREEIQAMLTQAKQAQAVGGDPVQAAMNVITGAYMGSDSTGASMSVPYSEVMEYHADVDVDITAL